MCHQQVFFCDSRKSYGCKERWFGRVSRCQGWQVRGCRPTRTAQYGRLCHACNRLRERMVQEQRRSDLKKVLQDIAAVHANPDAPLPRIKLAAVRGGRTMTLAVRGGAPPARARRNKEPNSARRARSRSPERYNTREETNDRAPRNRDTHEDTDPGKFDGYHADGKPHRTVAELFDELFGDCEEAMEAIS